MPLKSRPSIGNSDARRCRRCFPPLQWTGEAIRRRDEVRADNVKPISSSAVYRRIERLLASEA
jgi:hypothetical protein